MLNNDGSGWLKSLPEGAAPAEQDYLAMRGPSGKGLTRVGAEAGDLVIWQTTLPHYAAVNIGDAPRVAQYITMGPAPQQQDEKARADRIKFFDGRLAGNGNADTDAGKASTPLPLLPPSLSRRRSPRSFRSWSWRSTRAYAHTHAHTRTPPRQLDSQGCS